MLAFSLGTSELIGKKMVADGLISADQLAVALETQKNRGGNFGSILIKRGFVSRDALVDFIVRRYEFPSISLEDYAVDPEAVKLVPAAFARKHHFMPLFRIEDTITIAVSDPLQVFSIDTICSEIKHNIRPVMAAGHEIEKLIRSSYRFIEIGEGVPPEVEIISYGAETVERASNDLQEIASGSMVVAEVNRIIHAAVKEGASDIHIEPQELLTRVRDRLNGVLEERQTFPRTLHLPIVTRIKILAGMDIAERRMPQDGRVRLKTEGKIVDMRVSTYPTMHGEKVVIRLLGHGHVYGLEDLGMIERDRAIFERLIRRPHGIFLVTGPTGSGKTTTLYAALSRINSLDRNIVSIEDPIENEIAGIAQAQINPRAGFMFASALRSILRQDPDVIMIGEIRDRETVDIAVRAAITGHLVFSTLHTNTAVGAITRMTDLGVERFLIASATLGVMAQRLMRRLCMACRAPVDVNASVRSQLEIPADAVLYRAKGCEACRMQGYAGRIGIFELIEVDTVMREKIAAGASEDELSAEAHMRGFSSLRREAALRAAEGVTTIEEVLRVTGSEE